MSLLVLPAPALGQDAAEPPSPAVDQYRESVPTAKGPKPTATGNGKGSKLPPGVRDQIRRQAGEDADDLEAIATSPELGAPQGGDAAQGGKDGADGTARPVPSPDSRGGLSAAAEATTEGGGMGLLLGGGLATLAVVAGLAVVRRRTH